MDLQQLKIERKPAASSVRRRSNPWIGRGILLLLVVGLGWMFLPSLLQLRDRMQLPEVKVLVVRAPSKSAAAAIAGTTANGYVIAARRAALSSDVPGRIVEMLVTEGSVVKRGDVVARLYADEYAASLARAKAETAVADSGVVRAERALEAARAEEQQSAEAVSSQEQLLAESRSQHEFAAADQARADDLLQKGIGSQRDVDRARSDAEAALARVRSFEALLRRTQSAATSAAMRVQVAAADLQVAEAQCVAARAAQELAQATLDKTAVRAPFDGVVVLKDAEVGEVVSPNVQGGNNARGAVCTMVDFDSLEVQANVPETALSAVRLHAPAEVFLDAFPDRGLSGKVDRIWPTADRQKATVEVRVKLLERSEALRPEMGVRIVFLPPGAEARTDDAAPAPTARAILPETAVVEAAGVIGAFLLERDTVRFVELAIGERKGGSVAVERGLEPGQTVLLEPPPSLKSGDRVRPAAN